MNGNERKTLNDTLKHVGRVQELLHKVVERLLARARTHDDTKFQEPEFSSFVEVSAQLDEVEYGSEEYQDLLDELESALDHHYANQRHQPEQWEDSTDGMDLLDLIEMLVDWKAASERHEDGDVYESIIKNKERFEYTKELGGILHRTAANLFEE